jgi:O-antigen/teichoic acid export membrane protein
LAFVASALVSRALGPAGRGTYYLPVLAATTSIAFGKLGLDQANIFLYGTSGVPAAKLSAQNGFVAVVVGGVLAGLLALAGGILPSVFGRTPVPLLVLAGITVPLGLHTQLTGALLAMTGRVRRQYVAGAISAAAQLLGVAVCYAVGALTVTTALLLTVGGSVVTWSITAIPLQSWRASWLGFDGSLLRVSLKSALVLHLGMLLFFLHLRVDMYMIEAWLGNTALGHYSVSATLAETLMLASDAVAMAVLPSQMANSLQASAERALRVARVNGLLGGALGVLAAVLCGPAIRTVFGAAYAPAVAPMIALLPGVVMLGVQRVCGPPVLRAGRPSVIAGIYACTLLVNVGLNIVWIPRYGIIGASCASSVSYIVGSLLFVTVTARLAHMPIVKAIRFDAADRANAAQALRAMAALARALVSPLRQPL